MANAITSTKLCCVLWSTGIGYGHETLSDGRPGEVGFDAKSDRKNKPVKQTNHGRVEFSLAHHSKAQPPREIADEIEIMKLADFEACLFQFAPEFAARITPVMPKIDFNGRINFLPGGHEKTKPAALLF